MKLRKSTTNRVFSGVCGGLAESLGLPSVVVRLVFILGGGVLFWVYIALLFLMAD